MSRVFRALADPPRRRVLQLLRDRPMTAGEPRTSPCCAKPTSST